MELLSGIKAIDLALKVDDHLVISDIHIGFEEALNRQGVFVPRTHFEDLMKRVSLILKEAGTIKKIVINGDVKDAFGKIYNQEWRHTLQFIDFLKKHCEKLVIVKGNHDIILEPIAKKRGLTLVDYYFLENKKILIVHGHKLPEESLLKKARTIIIGHEHPSIAIGDKTRREKYKCFYVGTYKRKNLIVLPSLNLLTEGSDLMNDEGFSPFTKENRDNFKVFVVEMDLGKATEKLGEVLPFGKLKDLKKLSS